MGLLLMAAASLVLALGFDLTAIASIGSAVALLVFMLVTAAHFRVRSQTSARLGLLVAAIATTAVAFLTFVFTTLVNEPASAVTLAVILLASIALDHRWRSVRDHRRELASVGRS
jgi:L-asparagine transporter-like permease